MKNKQVKQMICDQLNDIHGLPVWMGFAFERCYKHPNYKTLTVYGLHKDSKPVTLGIVSMGIPCDKSAFTQEQWQELLSNRKEL